MKWVLQIMGFTLYTWDYCFNYEFFNIIIHPCQRQLRRDYIIVFVIFNCIQIIIFIWDIDILSHPSPFLRLPFPLNSPLPSFLFPPSCNYLSFLLFRAANYLFLLFTIPSCIYFSSLLFQAVFISLVYYSQL